VTGESVIRVGSHTPEHVVWWFRGVAYAVDLQRCRSALAERQDANEPDVIASLAQAIESSEETVRRFFQGRPPSMTVMLKILAELGIDFADVAKPWEGVGERIRTYRLRRGFTQVRLAHLIGRSERWLIDVEGGGIDPRLSDALALARVFRVLVDDLVRASTASAERAGRPPFWSDRAPSA
jgi:DNA-binding XRE family transcriptional regulator